MYNCSKPAKPFQAKLKINHSPSRVHQEHLGYYPTAEEAALAVARRLGPRTLTTSADIKEAIASSAEALIFACASGNGGWHLKTGAAR